MRAGIRWLTVVFILTSCTSGGPPSERATPAPAEPAVSVLDLDTRTQATITVGGEPDYLGTGFDSVWGIDASRNVVFRIDPSTSEVVATVRVGREPCRPPVAGAGTMWILACGDRTIQRIDPETNEVVATIPVKAQSQGHGAMDFGMGGLWFVSLEGIQPRLSLLDPRSGKVTTEIELPDPGSSFVAVDFGSVWVSSDDRGDDTVARVEPTTGKVTVIPVGSNPTGIAVGEGGVWVLSSADSTVDRIDPQTNEVSATIECCQGITITCCTGDIAAGDGSVWARGLAALSRIDPTIPAVVEETSQSVGTGGMRVAFGSLWMSIRGEGIVRRVALS